MSEIDTFFLGVVGLHSGMVTAHASAEYGSAVPSAAQPLAKRCNQGHSEQDQCGLDNGGNPQEIWQSNLPGNFGWLSWNGDTNSGYIELELDPNFQITNYVDDVTGCTVLQAGCWVQGSPGVHSSSGIKDKLDWWINSGEPMIIVIYDQEIERGSMSDFHVIGFAAFQITSYDLNSKKIYGTFKEWVGATPVCKTCVDTGYYTVHLIPDIVSPQPAAPTHGKICVGVINDLGGDGIVNPEDYYVYGATITIHGAGATTWVSQGISVNCVEVSPGTYSVTEVNPTSPIALPNDSDAYTPHNNTGNFVVGSGQTKDVLFLDWAPTLGNLVAKVTNLDTSGPFAGAGITVRVDNPGQTFAGSKTTDGSGTASFSQPPGPYLVYASPPAGYRLTTTSPLAATVTASQTVTVTFGMQHIPNGNICVQVLNDANNNGVQDAGETLIGNAQLSVRRNSNGQTYTMPSSNSGPYCWNNQEVDSYTVTEVNVSGYQSLDADTFTSTITDGGTWWVTFRDWVPPAGTICVLVYDDVTGDGNWTSGEMLATDAVVNILDWNNVVVGTWKTNGTEPHCFPNLPVGTYRVLETNPPYYTSTTTDSITIGVTGSFTYDARFGDRMTVATPTPTRTRTATPTRTNTPPTGATLTPTPTPTVTPVPGALCVTVFEDLNQNGIWDQPPPTPIGGPGTVPLPPYTPEPLLAPKDVTVLNSGGDPQGSWNGSGSQPYCFQNLWPGNYTAIETNPPGYGSTTADSVSAPITSGNSTMVTFGDILCLPTATTMGTPYFDASTNSWLLFWQNVYADYYQLYGSVNSIDPSQTSQWNLIATITGVNYSIVQGTPHFHFYVTATNNCGTSAPSGVVSLQ